MKEEVDQQTKEEEETARMLDTNMSKLRVGGKPPKMPEGAGMTMPTIMKQKRISDLPGTKSMFGMLTSS